MIGFTIVKNLMTSLKTLTGITIIRGNQLVKKQTYPYAVYNIIGVNEEPSVSNITERNDGTGVNITLTRYQYSEDTFSFTVTSKSYEEAREKTQTLFNAFKSETIHDFLKTNNCSAVLGIVNIQDRTIFLEADYEYRFGFDITIKSQTAFTETIENVNQVEVTETVYDEAETPHTEEIIIIRGD